MTRICVEEPCEHGRWPNDLIHRQSSLPPCDGGSRRVLTEGEYALVERTDSGLLWPDDTLTVIAHIIGDAWLHRSARILDALADQRET